VDLKSYDLSDLLLAAIKSEIDSGNLYSDQVKYAKQTPLRTKFDFLSKEEDHHRMILETMFRKLFPDREIIIPEKTPVPLPDLGIMDSESPLNEVLERCMEAELAARDYYLSIASIVGLSTEMGAMLEYLSAMEKGHYTLLKLELDHLTIDSEFPYPR
jgi:rubrerythrin